MKQTSKIFISVLVFSLTFLTVTVASPENGRSYERIDRHALKTPSYTTESIEYLTDYLIVSAQDDYERARVIFRWITANIDYDVQALKSNKLPSYMTPDAVLKKRISVCQGYAELFTAMAEQVGLESRVIVGYSKGEGIFRGKLDDRSSHAWNAVMLDGRWKLIDCTWGAGYLDFDTGKFIRSFDDHYFLTSPEEMIYTHLPDDPAWQLLKKPLSADQFLALPRLKPEFFKNGLSVYSHRFAQINVNDEVTVKFKSPSDVAIIAVLLKDNKEQNKSLTLSQYEDGIYSVSVVFQDAGNYVLRIFVNKKNGDNFDWAVDYDITANHGAGKNAVFPITYLGFQTSGAFLHAPMRGVLSKNCEHSFLIRVPGAEKVGVIEGDYIQTLDRVFKGDDLFGGKVKVGSGEIQIGAKFDESNQYAILLQYQTI